MNMQDKELDNLFRSKLDDFETEPSANVWQNIDADLKTGNRKRILLPLLSAAASIIVLVTAGIILIPHRIVVATHKPDKGRIVKSGVVRAPVTDSSNKNKKLASTKPLINAAPVKQVANLQPVKKQHLITQTQTTATTIDQQPANKQPIQEVIAEVQQKHNEVTQPKQTDTVILVANNANTPDIKPTQVVVPDKPLIAKAAPQPAKKHRIHSLGDMLNTVIAAVDKRKDKLIEFSDTDDDQSMITGVNLGVIAVKKEN